MGGGSFGGSFGGGMGGQGRWWFHEEDADAWKNCGKFFIWLQKLDSMARMP
jgi:hypothetical protein